MEISSEGNITLPLIGRVHVAGMTPIAAGRAIAKVIDADYLVNPEVVVALGKQKESAHTVLVLGQVSKPGTHPFGRGTSFTVLQAISAAGGFSPVANPKKIKIGKAEVLESGEDGNIFAIGSMVYPSLETSSLLKAEGINFGVINARFVKPLDEELLKQIANKPIVTVEENILTGGFGTGVLEFLSSIGVNTPILRLGLPDKFIEHGARDFLLNKYGLTPKRMVAKIKKLLTSDYLCTKLYNKT